MGVYRFRRMLLSVLYPNRCPFCGKLISSKEAFCPICPDSLDFWIGEPLVIPGLTGVCAVYQYNDRSAPFIHKLKGEYDDFSIYAAAVLMNQAFVNSFPVDIDGIAYIPMTKKEKRKRGYNQAEKLAKTISKITNIPLIPYKIKKIRETEEQKKLNSTQRLENLRGAFGISKKAQLEGKGILLIDDVCTTGATLSEAASVLINKGTKFVYGCVFAKTVINSDYF